MLEKYLHVSLNLCKIPLPDLSNNLGIKSKTNQNPQQGHQKYLCISSASLKTKGKQAHLRLPQLI